MRFVFNGDEETGSVVSRPLIERATDDAVATLVLEPGGEWGIKAGRKGVGIFNLTATGLEAHAGLDPAKGASAIHSLADVIGDLVAAADPERGTTVNVGRIAALGRPVLCGMGATGDGAHARHEHVTVADLPDRVALTAGTLLGLAAEPLSDS
ncbi:hypothetical protein SSPS47_15735 [Streptomyces sp. S4.7]|uniref:M20/M25/M40 family metallo-hydrolase n=1 Tax=Streptomyces sp. S4.7 TaxID=2705439 RepID=UPI001397CEA4|nr:hypothetical protein SSPS47_15735 [Streptomyces sp. S4.7]